MGHNREHEQAIHLPIIKENFAKAQNALAVCNCLQWDINAQNKYLLLKLASSLLLIIVPGLLA